MQLPAQRTLAFVALVVAQAGSTLSYRLAQRDGEYQFSPASALFVTEVAKLVVSLAVLLWTGSTMAWPRPARFAAWCALAASYFATNHLAFYLLGRVSPGDYALGRSLVPMCTASVLLLCFGEALNSAQWITTAIVAGGLAASFSTCDASRTDTHARLLLLASCLFTSASSVVNAKMLHDTEEASVHEQNVLLYLPGAVLNLVYFVCCGEKRFFEGFAYPAVWVMLAFQCSMGFAITLIYKHGGAMLKSVGSAAVVALLSLLDHVVFGAAWSLSSVGSSVVVIAASYLYVTVAMQLPKAQGPAVHLQRRLLWMAVVACAVIAPSVYLLAGEDSSASMLSRGPAGEAGLRAGGNRSVAGAPD